MDKTEFVRSLSGAQKEFFKNFDRQKEMQFIEANLELYFTKNRLSVLSRAVTDHTIEYDANGNKVRISEHREKMLSEFKSIRGVVD